MLRRFGNWYLGLSPRARALFWAIYGTVLWGLPMFFAMSWFAGLGGNDPTEDRSFLLWLSLGGGFLFGLGMWWAMGRKIQRARREGNERN